jgi:hypothetical protein
MFESLPARRRRRPEAMLRIPFIEVWLAMLARDGSAEDVGNKYRNEANQNEQSDVTRRWASVPHGRSPGESLRGPKMCLLG